ncbi:MAG: cell division protein ZapA [Bacteroidales bacterium]|nr:cell division protein ZapA [Candidatus Cryptobacteroides fimicaballi]
MAEQSITIKIGEKTYPLKVSSPEVEQMMRLAAERINEMLAKYNAKFPESSLADKLAFVALNETASRIAVQNAELKVRETVEAFDKELADYLQKNSK